MRLWRRLTGSTPGEWITVENSWGLGNGRPLRVERVPDLARLLDAPDPAPPQELQGGLAENGWTTPDSIRFGMVMAYLHHPDPQVRAVAIQQAVQRYGSTVGVQGELVDLAADPDPVVHLPAVRALWSLQRDECCERAVMELRDEIHGHSCWGVFPTTEPLRLGKERAVAALDRMVKHAPDDAAREGLRALIAEHMVIPERVPEMDPSEVSYVETVYRTGQSGHRSTHEVYRAPSRDHAIAYLKSRPVSEELYYREVDTPDGTFSRDIEGIYEL